MNARFVPVVACAAAVPAFGQVQHFFSGGHNPAGDLAFQAAIGGRFTEFDVEAFGHGAHIDAIRAGSILVDFNLLNPSGVRVSSQVNAFGSGFFVFPTVMHQTALLNSWESRCAAFEIVFTPPVTGFGTWLYDDGPPHFNNSFRLRAREAGGAESVSPWRNHAPGYAVEGFFAAISPSGIDRVVIESDACDWIELDHLQIGSGVCYADCDTTGGRSTLDIFDFLCFQNRYDTNDPYACDCDTASGPGVCDIFDFLCFQNAFAAGCP